MPIFGMLTVTLFLCQIWDDTFVFTVMYVNDTPNFECLQWNEYINCGEQIGIKFTTLSRSYKFPILYCRPFLSPIVSIFSRQVGFVPFQPEAPHTLVVGSDLVRSKPSAQKKVANEPIAIGNGSTSTVPFSMFKSACAHRVTAQRNNTVCK